MDKFVVGGRVLFRESTNGAPEQGHVIEVLPIEDDGRVEFTIALDDGTSVIAWVGELESI